MKTITDVKGWTDKSQPAYNKKEYSPMQQLIPALITFSLSSIYVIFLDRLAISPTVILKIVALPVIIFLIIAATLHFWKKVITHRAKWLFLSLFTLCIQLLIIATGGFKSPFIILIHLFMIGLSFLLTFSTSFLFLLFSFIVLLADILLHQSLMTILLSDPTALLLQIVSLIAIIPLAYIISEHYHFKDLMFKKLNTRVTTDEAIMKNVQELIIITDPKLHILSVNEAVEKLMHKTRSELLDKPLFDLLLLKDSNDKLVTEQTLFVNGDTNNEPQKTDEYFTLMKSPSAVEKKFMIHAQTTKNLEGKVSQISFVLSENAMNVSMPSVNNSLIKIIERSRIKYEAINEHLKKDLHLKGPKEIQDQVILLEKIENDIYHLQTYKDTTNTTNAQIDIAQLSKQIVFLNQDFANIFHVLIDFALRFSIENTSPLTVNNFIVKPEYLTGPFFTVSCDTKQIEYITKKILDLSILLASSPDTKTPNPKVILSVEEGKNDDIVVEITGTAPQLTKEDLDDIFIPYYGKLHNKTNLHAGSGLEGFLIKKISEQLKLSLNISYRADPSPAVIVTLRIPKKTK